MGIVHIKDSRKKSMKNHQTENDTRKGKLEGVIQSLLSHDANSVHSRDCNFVGFCKQTAVVDDKNLQTYNKYVSKGLNLVH